MNFTSLGDALYNMLIIIEFVHTDLPEPVAPAIITCGILAISPTITLPAISLPTTNDSLLFFLEDLKASLSKSSLIDTISVVLLGTSTPIADLPGIGASILTPDVAKFKAISSARPVILDTLIPDCG